jgi:MFS family permease
MMRSTSGASGKWRRQPNQRGSGGRPSNEGSGLALLDLPEARALGVLSPDGRLLFATRVVRTFSYGLLSVVLVLYLAAIGLRDREIGLLLTATLVGDAVVSLAITSNADRLGRRRMLVLSGALVAVTGIAFALSGNLLLLTIAAILGTLSPGGGEVGPSQPIELAALPQTIPDRYRTNTFAWYNLVGSFAAAIGALCAGLFAQTLQSMGTTPVASYRDVLAVYGALGLVLAFMFSNLSPEIEVAAASVGKEKKRWLGLHRSRSIVLKLSALFMVDSFAGGLLVQSFVAYWLTLRFGVAPVGLGAIFFGTNLLAGLSALAAARVAGRIGLVNTMVFTHLPSNIFLILVPLMPSLPLAIALLLARNSISQMDIPTRQPYVVAVVDPDERSAASGITTIARTLASSAGPVVTGALFSASLLSIPFLLAGGLKIAYDLTLWRSFRLVRPPEEG